MKTVERIVERVRRETSNSNNSNTVASDSLSDDEFVDALNDAQERLQSLISNVYSTLFEKQITIPYIKGESTYTIDDRVYLNNRIVEIKSSPTGRVEDYRELEARDIKETRYHESLPYCYIRTAESIIVSPIPNASTGHMLITYERTLPELDKKRAFITSGSQADGEIIMILNTVDTTLTSIVVGEKITICSPSGTVKAKNLEVVSYTEGTSTLVIQEGTYTYGTDFDDGDAILLGKDSVNISLLPDICEKYLVAYANWQIFSRDKLKQTQAAKERLAIIEDDILESFSNESKDVKYIPIFNDGYY